MTKQIGTSKSRPPPHPPPSVVPPPMQLEEGRDTSPFVPAPSPLLSDLCLLAPRRFPALGLLGPPASAAACGPELAPRPLALDGDFVERRGSGTSASGTAQKHGVKQLATNTRERHSLRHTRNTCA
jgi:hypothetical protein